MRRALGPLLVTLGTFGAAAVQWYLVWLFSRDGAAAVGAYSAVLAVATPLTVAAGLGLRNLYVTHRTLVPVQAYARLRWLLLAASTLVLLAVGVGLGHGWWLVAAVAAMKVADAMLDLVQAWLQRARRLEALGVLMVANPLLSAVAATVAVRGSGSVAAGVAASAAVSGVLLAATGPRARDAGPSPALPPAEVVRAALPVTGGQLAMSLLLSVPVWLVQARGSHADVGVYAAAAYLVVAANLAGASLQTVELSRLRVLRDEAGDRAVLADVRAAVTRYAAAGVVVAAVVTWAGPAVLGWVYGPAFRIGHLGVGLLAGAALTTALAYLATSSLLVLNAWHHQLLVSLAALAGAATTGVVAWAVGAEPVLVGCGAALGGGVARLAAGVAALVTATATTAATTGEGRLR